MSSILQALRRVEEEERLEKVPLFADVGAQRSPAGRFLLLIAVFIAGVGVAVAGFYMIHPPEPAVVSAEEGRENAPVFRVEAPQAPVVAKPVVSKPAEKPSPPVVPVPKVPETSSQEQIIRIEFPEKQSIEVAPDVTPDPPTYVENKIEEMILSDSPTAPPVEDVQNLPAADASTYHLQGVRWSETPSRRIAVINSQILREGGVLDGAKILTITAEGVVLTVDGRRQFLAFSGR
ncbi:hypothetical protein DSLASN_03760 [Desulfoluna limicola]|uniref:Type II secretion system protein GspB C-terminal domain-containing protein n=1 Tax=Desulfoluna limicola TaxID=2810562 RepID=A0ABM7PCG8_9BACT|nr:general secretion pathway protein GspB [Desulfoluna limicola]BCS94744.1 hypothetical protein DSLASN_03760 [Desulfoluna limicola]